MRRALLLAALFAGCAIYFAAGAVTTLELMDEGQITYPSWLVALGSVPYRDFTNAYGPSVFLLNGALFALFGPDLLVVRVGLVIVKAILAVLVYGLSRRVASPVAALIVTAVFTAIWGTPIWVFNTPYANHYGVVLSLLALAVFVSSPRATGARLFVVGLLLGLAATFKQTLGIFYLLSFVLGVIFRARDGRAADAPASAGRWLASGARVLVLVSSVGLGVGYMSGHLASASSWVLFAPFVGGALIMMWRELGGASRTNNGADLGALLLVGAGFSLPLVVCALWFLSRGALAALVFNTLSGLPQHIEWFDPLPVPTGRTCVLALAIASALGLLRTLGRASNPPGSIRAGVFWAGGLVIGATGFLLAARDSGGVWAYVTGGWITDAARLLWFTPVVLVWATAGWVFRGASAADGDRPNDVAMLWFFAAGALLQLYPAADLPHIAMILPVCLPLLAVAIDRYVRVVDGFRRWALAPTLAVSATALFFIAPCAQMLVRALGERPPAVAGLDRASRIWVGGKVFADVAALAPVLRAEASGPGGALIITNQQLLYFLAGVQSPLPREEYLFYLVGGGVLTAPDLQTLMDERALVARLAAARPLIVDSPDLPASARFKAALPEVARYISEQYEPLRQVGAYSLLRHRAGD